VSAIGWLFDSKQGAADRLIPRWIFLRALAVIYFSAFYSLAFQIKGLIGPDGILPANLYLTEVARSLGSMKFWYAPTLLWISSGSHMLMGLCIVGMIASMLLLFNIWPRGMLVLCFLCFLSFVSAAQDFSGYQSDGMLLEAGFIVLFFAPSGFRPGFGKHSPSRASLLLLQWEWFRIYFESGLVKLVSGDPQWRHLTAMDEYYQNCPLPTWVGWYLQHLPHGFHWLSALGTLVMELVLVWMIVLPRRFRILLFFITTVWQLGVIFTANYTFLNYLVLSLGFLLLDDKVFAPLLCGRFQPKPVVATAVELEGRSEGHGGFGRQVHAFKVAVTTAMLLWIFYVTTVELLWILWPRLPFPRAPIAVLEPFRIANRYGLFAVMTRGRYEIEFQGSNDGQNWIAYPFLYKPQALNEPPRIYAPYQPRFDWNLWFASLGTWRDNMFVASAEERLLNNSRDVLTLFRESHFPNTPPKEVRAVLWRYWFTSIAEKRATGNWWKRQYLGTYAPTLTPGENGRLMVLEWPSIPGPPE